MPKGLGLQLADPFSPGRSSIGQWLGLFQMCNSSLIVMKMVLRIGREHDAYIGICIGPSSVMPVFKRFARPNSLYYIHDTRKSWVLWVKFFCAEFRCLYAWLCNQGCWFLLIFRIHKCGVFCESNVSLGVQILDQLYSQDYPIKMLNAIDLSFFFFILWWQIALSLLFSKWKMMNIKIIYH